MNHSIQNSLRVAAAAVAISLLSIVASARAASSADAVASAMSTTGSLTVKAAGPYVEIGSYRIWVSSHLGKPSQILRDGTYVYQGFSVTNSAVYGALVVKFNQGRVSDLRLVSPAVLTAMIATPKAAAQTLIASR